MSTNSILKKSHPSPSLEISDAQINSTSASATTLDRITYCVVAFFIIALPLFMGGNDFRSETTVKLACFFLLALALIQDKSIFQLEALQTSRKLATIVALSFSLFILQIVPIPVSILSFLSSQASKAYIEAGANFGVISLDPYHTISNATWFLSLALLLLTLCLKHNDVRLVTRRLGSLSPTLSFNPYAVLFIIGGLICGSIALAHWASAAESYFGLYGEDRGSQTRRAHWPFVNPNHLSVYLQMSFILCYGCFLDQCSSIKQRLNARLYRRRNATGKHIRHDVILAFVFGLSCFFLAVTNLLTASRMGNVLLIFGAASLLLLHLRIDKQIGLVSVIPVLNRPISKKAQKIFLAFATLGFIVSVVAITGRTGQQLAQDRIAYGLTTSFDDVRWILFATTLEIIAAFPILGTGLGSWHIAAKMLIPNELAGFSLDFAHNDLLQYVAETGLLGFALLVAALYYITVKLVDSFQAVSSPGTKRAFVASILAVSLPMLHSLVDFPLHMPALAVALVVLLAPLIAPRSNPS